MTSQELPRVAPQSGDEWRAWLSANHDSSVGVWVVLARNRIEPISYEDLVCEALCWGWVDGLANPLDETHTMLRFTPRRPASAWAATNKRRVAQLLADGRMQPSGQAVVDGAKASGSWTLLDDAEALIESDELTVALDAVPQARLNWDAFPPSARKFALSQIAFAKRPETKSRRVAKIVEQAANNIRPS
ncbi:YdeI/OmpD-associated family protein [Gordonia sp. CPCC 205333]|uniref:YdeI/OmpD-associated family protein n=1 Tax=Gordonia sp. CPCC 205333 TaxID=3140790 RepID=UPI003AF3A6B8